MNELPRVSPKSMMREFRDANLGDERLNRRVIEVMGALASKPQAPIAGLFDTEADVEATYRFVRNPNVKWEDVFEPHADETARRCKTAGKVIVAHDTTTHRVSEEADLKSYINTGKKGFFSHASLAVSNDDSARPLGLLALQCVFRPHKKSKSKTAKGRKLSGSETAKLKDKESARWVRGVEIAEARLSGVDAVHVIDREGDSFGLFSLIAATDSTFVIRACKNRRARPADAETKEWGKVFDLLGKAKKARIRRKVKLSRRDKKVAPVAAKAHPPREARLANLRVTYTTLELKKPRYGASSPTLPKTLKVNVVHVYELRPPQGAERIEWVLLTNLPVTNATEAEAIVDIYRRRWLIEEFFAALKGGCRYRERRLTNQNSILNTLVLLVPVAWKALDLRQLSRSASEPAASVFDELEMQALRAKASQMKFKLGRHPSAEQALALIARLGGHLKSSGPPGWKTIMKGMDRFLGIVEGFALAGEKM